MAICTVELKTWSDIHEYQRLGWIYRGQRAAAWELSTSFERLCDNNSFVGDEKKRLELALLRDFRRGLHQYSTNVPSWESKIEWLSVMQHHGAPTRLLDFTYSLYVAVYFALEAADSDCAVWAMHGPWVLKQSVAALELAGNKEVTRLNSLVHEGDEQFCYDLIFKGTPANAAIPLNPFRLNERLRIQKGLFLLPGSINISFMQNLTSLHGSDLPDNIVKLILRKAVRAEALERLFYMNISRTSLFPGLDGYAQSLSVFHSSFKPVKWW